MTKQQKRGKRRHFFFAALLCLLTCLFCSCDNENLFIKLGWLAEPPFDLAYPTLVATEPNSKGVESIDLAQLISSDAFSFSIPLGKNLTCLSAQTEAERATVIESLGSPSAKKKLTELLDENVETEIADATKGTITLLHDAFTLLDSTLVAVGVSVPETLTSFEQQLESFTQKKTITKGEYLQAQSLANLLGTVSSAIVIYVDNLGESFKSQIEGATTLEELSTLLKDALSSIQDTAVKAAVQQNLVGLLLQDIGAYDVIGTHLKGSSYETVNLASLVEALTQ